MQKKKTKVKRKKRQEGIKPEFKIYDSDRLKQGGKKKGKIINQEFLLTERRKRSLISNGIQEVKQDERKQFITENYSRSSSRKK